MVHEAHGRVTLITMASSMYKPNGELTEAEARKRETYRFDSKITYAAKKYRLTPECIKGILEDLGYERTW